MLLIFFIAWVAIAAAVIAIPNLEPLLKTLIISFSAIAIEFLGIYYFTRKNKEIIDFYSPVHSMIMILKNEIQLKRVQQMNIGEYVDVESLKIDYKKVSEAFTHHRSEFKNSDLKTWRKIEKEIEQKINGGGFYLDKERLRWFNSLERRYNQ